MSKTVEIVAKFGGVRFTFGDAPNQTIIGTARLDPSSKELARQCGVIDPDDELSIKGEADRCDLNERSTYRFLGTFANYFNKRRGCNERQFHFRTFVEHIPLDIDGLSRYIANAGSGNGIGPAKAKKLVQHFGTEEVLEKCRTAPNEVASICKITAEQAETFASLLRSKQATERSQIECDKLLAGRGFPKTLARKVIKEWGNKAAEIITEDPYCLMQFKGIGFRLADKLYMELGLDPRSIKRQALCLWYALASDMQGHTWFAATHMVPKFESMIGPGASYIEAVKHGIELGKRMESEYGCLASIRSDGFDGPLKDGGSFLWLAEGKVASQEEKLAGCIAEALTESEQQIITRFADEEMESIIPAEVMRCARCRRALTSDEVFILAGKPYGPTCINKVTHA